MSETNLQQMIRAEATVVANTYLEKVRSDASAIVDAYINKSREKLIEKIISRFHESPLNFDLMIKTRMDVVGKAVLKEFHDEPAEEPEPKKTRAPRAPSRVPSDLEPRILSLSVKEFILVPAPTKAVEKSIRGAVYRLRAKHGYTLTMEVHGNINGQRKLLIMRREDGWKL